MKVRLALAASLLVLAGAAGAALNAYRTAVTLPESVKLGDGSVLVPGRYDVEIHYKGFGGAAEMWFLQKGQLKGKTDAEARGFPSREPAAVNGDSEAVKLRPADDKAVKLRPADEKAVKLRPADDKAVKLAPATEYGPKRLPAGEPQGFSWSRYGFNPGIAGKAVPAGRELKISVDSRNSAAGFNAILPYVEKGRK